MILFLSSQPAPLILKQMHMSIKSGPQAPHMVGNVRSIEICSKLLVHSMGSYGEVLIL